MPVTTHKLNHVVCESPPCRGRESIMRARCTCGEYDSGQYSDVLAWWSNHIAQAYSGKSAMGLLDHIAHVAFAPGTSAAATWRHR